MSKKFTEEQYQKIVEIGERFDEDRAKKSTEVIDYVFDEYPDAYNYTEILDKALAISNPITREWAHDNFVEKEKEYYWTSKKSDKDNEHCRLYRRIKRSKGSGITSYFNHIGCFDNDMSEQLTESEIKAWGYNPEMFDKEEV